MRTVSGDLYICTDTLGTSGVRAKRECFKSGPYISVMIACLCMLIKMFSAVPLATHPRCRLTVHARSDPGQTWRQRAEPWRAGGRA